MLLSKKQLIVNDKSEKIILKLGKGNSNGKIGNVH